MEKLNRNLIIGVSIIIILLGIVAFKPADDTSIGSVARGGEYKSLTTFATTSAAYIVKTGSGTFGSAVINVLGTGHAIFYDATTTNANLRRIAATTSLPVIAAIGASQAAGTYTYDASFYNGLMAVYAGSQGTSTITWR